MRHGATVCLAALLAAAPGLGPPGVDASPNTAAVELHLIAGFGDSLLRESLVDADRDDSKLFTPPPQRNTGRLLHDDATQKKKNTRKPAYGGLVCLGEAPDVVHHSAFLAGVVNGLKDITQVVEPRAIGLNNTASVGTAEERDSSDAQERASSDDVQKRLLHLSSRLSSKPPAVCI